ncbi:MAG: DUF885 domain-containing protein [Polyangiaceae bacterium]|nr:DUF885 domain-containing protein [Polyangiaceae bacterium]MCL4753262.1 DUF885 family protein [Myxococcales bacterium]
MASPFELSERYVEESADLDPLHATSLGLPGRDHLWGDALGLEGQAARMDLVRRYRAAFAEHAAHPDDKERLAARVMLGALDEELAADAAGEHFRDLSHLASSFQRIRSTFDLMKTESEEDWRAVCARLEGIAAPYAQLRQRLSVGRERGHHVAARQVASVARQARRLAAADSAFDRLAAEGARAHPALASRLAEGVARAKAAVTEFAEHLERDVLPSAPESDGVGAERYRPALDRAMGLDVDPREAYAWGWEELRRLLSEMRRAAEQIAPGASLEEVTRLLETDPARSASSPEAFLDFVAARLSEARERLSGVHFDVDPRIVPLSVELAPVGSPLGAYYQPPSEDFSRPGGIRYAIGEQATFPLYHQVSTAYHEGFPGHHLQIGTAMTRADRLCRAHRLTVWYSGYGEGWAMYTERLMGELGYFEKPDYELGMLAKQLYRAARVVVDIGLHLGLELDRDSPFEPGAPWTYERAIEFMRLYGHRTPAQAESEVMRYLGWPGQAPTYKLGEREIAKLRDEAWARFGERMTLKEFHERVIGNGAMRLDLLRELVLA